MRIIKAEGSHVLDIVRVHEKAFEKFFLTSLGTNFLRLYYSSSLQNKKTILLISVDKKNNILGFAMGTILSKGFHKELIKENFLKFVYQGLIILLNKPHHIIRLFNNLNKNQSNLEQDDKNYGELLSIGVSPEFKGMGVGKELVEEFEKNLKKRKCNTISLTTDYYNNDYAVSFYKKNGYRELYDFIAYPNRKMYKLIKKL